MMILSALLALEPPALSADVGDESLSEWEEAPPVVIFLIDRSSVMGQDCGPSGSPSGVTCLEAAADAIEQLARHNSWAEFGVVGTDPSSGFDFSEIAPVGSTADEIATAMAGVSADAGSSRNLAESLSAMADNYLNNLSTGSPDPWDDAPISARCQEVHVITLSAGLPAGDSFPTHNSSSGMAGDITCPSATYSGNDQCGYDNVAFNLFENFDARGDLDDDQYVTTHTVGLKITAGSTEDSLFQSASDETGGAGLYAVADEGDELIARIAYVLVQIRQGAWSRSPPILSADGSRMISSFYEIAGEDAAGDLTGSFLGQGHVRAYALDTDPDSASYGEVLYTGGGPGGSLWDAGEQLVYRPATGGESNPMDQDGFGQRDIFTYEPYLAQYLSSTHLVWAENNGGSQSSTRMNFDASFVDAVADTNRLWLFLNYLFAPTDDHDLDKDSDVDTDDLQVLVDFARGVSSVTFRYLDLERGSWRLGDSPNAVPAVVTARNDNFSNDPTYRRFLSELTRQQEVNPALYPDLVLVPANDGMLHAFALQDHIDAPSGSLSADEDNDQAGEELWAWIPAYVLYEREHYMAPNGYLEGWSGSMVDQLLYGRTLLMDGQVVVEDVWMDIDSDGAKTCDLSNFPYSCEWRRVAIVQQGDAGPSTLALDITVPSQPEYLWEHPTYYDALYESPAPDESAWGRSTSRPVMVNLLDQEAAHGTEVDRWVAIWGGGRGISPDVSASYAASSEASIHFWQVAEDVAGDYADAIHFDLDGSNGHPEAATTTGLDSDSDGRYEYGYISGAVTAVDYDSDGDADVLYFPVTASYEPADLGDPDGDGLSGIADLSESGSTWMYKAVMDSGDLDDPTWCEFVDPADYGVIDADGGDFRPEVYYAATAAWQSDGRLGIYWGSGGPYSRTSDDPGYFFGFVDPDPTDCASVAEPICETTGFITLDSGEGLTGEPLVYGGTVYFPTRVPGVDTCDIGQGRIWGLTYESCSAGIDADNDGVPESEYLEVEGYPSSLTVSDQGKLMWSNSGVDPDGDIADMLGPGGDPFNGVNTLALKEIF